MVFFAGESLAPAAAAIQVSITFFIWTKGMEIILPFLLVTFLSGAIFLAFSRIYVNRKLVRSCKAADADFFFFLLFCLFFCPNETALSGELSS